MSAQVLDWLTQGVTWALVIYFGLHLRSQLRTLKTTVETQKATIEAQAESMKAQSVGLQDFERHSKIMQQVIAFFDPQAQLQREQAYKERVDRDLAVLIEASKEMNQRVTEMNMPMVDTIRANAHDFSGVMRLLNSMLPFLYPGLRQSLIEAADLDAEYKAEIQTALTRD